MSAKEKFQAINRDFNDLPRRLVYGFALFAALALFFVLFKYVAPFAIGFAVSLMIEPVVRRITPAFRRIHLGRTGAALVCVLVVYGVLLYLLSVLLARLVVELQALIPTLLEWVRSASAMISGWVQSLENLEWNAIPDDVLAGLVRQITLSLDQLGANITSFAIDQILPIAGYAMSKALSVSQLFLFTILTIVSTFYFSSDREKIIACAGKYIPERLKDHGGRLRKGVYRAFFGQLRATAIMFVVTTVELSIGFLIMGLDYAVLLALFIALLDALPVIGAGLVLIPAAIYGFLFGPMWLGVGMALMYVTTIVVRQIVEPRVIGQQFGLHPLITMMAMFAGYMLASFLGMLLGPVLALLLKAVLASDEDLAAPAAGARAFSWPWQKKRGKPPEKAENGQNKRGGNHSFREKKQ